VISAERLFKLVQKHNTHTKSGKWHPCGSRKDKEMARRREAILRQALMGLA
jgi:hypothetical protein